MLTTNGADHITIVEAVTPLGATDVLIHGTEVKVVGLTIDQAGLDAAVFDAVKARAAKQIDDVAETIRLTHLTPGAGQSAVYLRKDQRAREAKAILDGGGALTPGEWPILEADVGITAPDLPGVIAAITAQADAWEAMAAVIEHERLGGKSAINVAVDAAGAQAACDTACAALNALALSAA